MPKETWSKKEGLDLRWDKNKVLKKELQNKGRKSKKVPAVQEPQVHEGKDNYRRYKTNVAQLIDHGKFKRRTMKKISRLRGLHDLALRGKKLRKIEGRLYHVLTNNGSFTEVEADKIVDAYMICRERSDPDHHPLQTATISGMKYKSTTSIQNRLIFSDPIMKRALSKRGFYLNNGPFSAAESLTLMKNFESFLARHGRATDRDSIWHLLHDEFLSFFRTTRMFCYIGKGLNRTSYQLYVRLSSMYHPYLNGKSDAKTDAYILERTPALATAGLHRKYKQVGEEINRYRLFVHDRYKALVSNESSFNRSLRRTILQLITDQQKCTVKEIDPTNVDLAQIATQLGLDEETLTRFWRKEGLKMCARAALSRWKLKDSLALLQAIETDGEEDENCIDFKGIYERSFIGKVQNWEHLREHFLRVRRIVPYYMLNDLQSTVAAAMKEIKVKMEERGVGEEEGEDDGLEEDEDDFIE